MRDAVAEDNWEALRIVVMVEPDLELKVFQTLLLPGRSSIVLKLFNLLRNGEIMSSNYSGGPELVKLVKNKVKEEREKRGTY